MANLIALEWDDSEARVAVADVRRGSVVLEQAFSVALPKEKTAPDASGATGTISISGAHDLGAIGRRINDALTARGIRRVKTLVGVGRANIELKNLTLPPCPPEEQPELVRFQAEREFNTLTDEWPLDFLPIPGEADEALTVLAAAISPELVAEIQITCEAANLTPQRLILRPCAAASLLSRTKPGHEQKLRLLVDLLTEEADLTVLAGDSPVFMRTARLPAETVNSDPLRTLLPEIRRTIAAVHARFQGRQIEQVFLCGEATAQATIAREIGRELELPTEVFNPLSCCTVSADLRRHMPEHPGRFAPLIGMMLDDAADSSNTIDFLNPRKKPEAKSRRRELTIAGAAAATLLLLGVGWFGYQLYSLDSEITEKQTKSSGLDSQVKVAKESTRKASAIDDWLAGEPNWLDELAMLSKKAPSAQEFKLTSFQTPYNYVTRANVMQLDAVASTSKAIDQFYQAFRDDQHNVRPKHEFEDDTASKGRYGWTLAVDIDVKPTKSAPAASGVNTPKTTASASGTSKENAPAEQPKKAEPPADQSKTPQPSATPPASAPETNVPAANNPPAKSEASPK